MGTDGFVSFIPWQPVPRYRRNETLALEVYRRAIEYGAGGVDFSWTPSLVAAARVVAKEHPQVSLFANCNWRCGISLRGRQLIELKEVMRKYVYEMCLSMTEKLYVQSLDESVKQRWFGYSDSTGAFAAESVVDIVFDDREYITRVRACSEFARYCVVGTDIVDWLIVLGRTDIVERMLAIVLECGMVPVALTHWPSITVSFLRQCPFAACWVLFSPSAVFFGEDAAARALADLPFPVYAIRITRECSHIPFSDRLARIARYPFIYGVVIGLNAVDECVDTVPTLLRILAPPTHIRQLE
jgi:hypothetical protein